MIENYGSKSNSQIYTRIVHKSLNIMAGNDVINYFRPAANCVNVLILGQVQFEIFGFIFSETICIT